MTVLERLRKAFQWSGIGGLHRRPTDYRQGQNYSFLLPGSSEDWRSKAGDLWLNSCVQVCINYIVLSFMEAKLSEARIGELGKPVFFKPGELRGKTLLSDLLLNPNDDEDFNDIMAGLLTSFLTDGNAYLYIVRGPMGEPSSLQFIPHFMIEPRWPLDGSQFISHYDYFHDGLEEKLRKEDVVHFRYGKDLRAYRKGSAPLKSLLREIFGDNEAQTYFARLMETSGYFPMTISPSGDYQISDESAKLAIDTLREYTRGDNRGRPIVLPTGIKIDKMAFSPEEMALDKVLQRPMERICSALMIDPMVLGLPSSNRGSYDNRKVAERAAWDNAILPWMDMFSARINKSLTKEFYSDGIIMAWDVSSVNALQFNQEKMHPIYVQSCGGPFLSVNAVRALAGYSPTDNPDDDEVRLVGAAAKADSALGTGAPSADTTPGGDSTTDRDPAQDGEYGDVND